MKNTFLITCLLFTSTLLSAQDRAPSCWLKYQDNFAGDIIINTLKVKAPSPLYTYYCSMQWNAGLEGGGYCGMQEHPDGRNFIYSIWDPIGSNEAITPAYMGAGTEVENFGGEGTGLKSWNFELGWETDHWYSTVSRAWNDNGHTMFGYWVYDEANAIWHHLVTMDFPVPGVRFQSRTGSFIEDWLGNGWLTREIHHRGGWKRKTANLSWTPLSGANFERVFPDPGCANYIDNYDGGVVPGSHYFMKSGGAVSPVTNTSGAILTLPSGLSAPGFPTGIAQNLALVDGGDSLHLSWEVDTHKSPQFSWHIRIFDNPDFSGSPLIIHSDTLPHGRQTSVDLSSIGNKNCYFQFYITDIFDQDAEMMTGSFGHVSSATENCAYAACFAIHKDSANQLLRINNACPIAFGELSAEFYDFSGRLLKSSDLAPVLEMPRNGVSSQPFIIKIMDKKSGQLLLTKKI
jgi:hypothetical protein